MLGYCALGRARAWVNDLVALFKSFGQFSGEFNQTILVCFVRGFFGYLLPGTLAVSRHDVALWAGGEELASSRYIQNGYSKICKGTPKSVILGRGCSDCR